MNNQSKQNKEEKKTMTHTPTPWKVSGNQIQSEKLNNYGNWILLEMPLRKEPTMQDMTEEDKANAEFIVHAVNAHDELVEACKLALDVLSYDEPRSTKTETILKNAIAKAEGK